MELDYAILADGVSNRQDGKLDIFGASWDTIFAPAVPAIHPQITLATRILASKHEVEASHQLRVILSAADGQEIARAEGVLEALDQEQRDAIPAGKLVGLGAILNFQRVVFPLWGAYQLAILLDNQELRTPLRLFVERPPGA